MQSFSKREIEWAAQAISEAAGQMEIASEAAATRIERGLARLRAEQFQVIAGKLAQAAAAGDKRIAIR